MSGVEVALSARDLRIERPAAGFRLEVPSLDLHAGEVLAVLGSDLNQKLRIKFERAGVKTVMVKYANLELA